MNRTHIQICFLSILLGLSTTATAAKQRGFPSIEIPEGKAAIYIYRDKKMGGSLAKHWFYFNRAVAVAMHNGGCSIAIVDPGVTLVEMASKAGAFTYLTVWIEKLVFKDAFKILDLDVDPGKSYYLKMVLNEKDTLAPKPVGHSIFLVPKTEALKSTKKCKYRDAEVITEDEP